MIKTASEIESDMYKLVKERMSSVISGCVYRHGVRPTNRTDHEDVVVSFLSGIDTQMVQSGVVVVNCYVPYRLLGDEYRAKNIPRCMEIERALLNIITTRRPNEYLLKTDRSVMTEEEENCSRCTLRIKYKYNTISE